MTIKDALMKSVAETELPLSELVSLLSFVTNISKEQVFAGSSHVMSESELQTFENFVSRRARGVPMAYLKNSKEFFGRSFYVNEHVLVPRPETEHLIEHALASAKILTPNSDLIIADIGTGSGAIALTMALELPTSHVIAVDISPEALLVAQKNAQQRDIEHRVDFLLGDLLAPILEAGHAPTMILANLPYIAADDTAHVDPDVHAHEPHLALYSGKKGTEHYARLFEQVRRLSTPPRFIIGEMGIDQTALITELAATFTDQGATCSFFPDLAGIPRVFLISFPATYV